MAKLIFPKTYPVACHTDNVSAGGTFVAIKGMEEDGVSYIPKALELGAKIIVVEESVKISDDTFEQIKFYGAQLKYVSNCRLALSKLSAKALFYPAKKLKIIAVTGTKGKTTIVFLIEHLLRAAGFKTALLSTLKNFILSNEFETELTTPHPDYLHTFFDLCVKQGVEWVVMEVAAQALSLHRVADVKFDAAIFTNISQEHAEFFENIENYFDAKKSIINYLKSGAPLILNADDEKVKDVENFYQNSFLFSCKNNSSQKNNFLQENNSSQKNNFLQENNSSQESNFFQGLEAKILNPTLSGFDCQLKFHGKIRKLKIPLIGEFNLENISAAFLCMKLVDIDEKKFLPAFQTFSGVLGRMNKYILPNKGIAFIDSAHTPSSFEAVFKAVRPFCKNLIAMFGAGGDRDSIKRPQMGEIAARYCDLVVLTTDNSRTENPQKIIKDVFMGVPEKLRNKVIIEQDREKAIRLSYKNSSSDSILLLLGKGPFEYQITNNIKSHFSERKILKSL